MDSAQFAAAVEAATQHKYLALLVEPADLTAHGKPHRAWTAEVVSADGRRWGVLTSWIGHERVYSLARLAPAKKAEKPVVSDLPPLCFSCCVDDALPGRKVCAGCAS